MKRRFNIFIFLLLPVFAADCFAQADKARLDDANAFTIVRIKWTPSRPVYGMQYFSGPVPPWAHDYPYAEINMYDMLDRLGSAEMLPVFALTHERLVVTLEEDRIFDFPFLYICEIGGFWEPSQDEAKRLREYLNRGGFLIVDDFRSAPEWRRFVLQMNKVVPNYTKKKLSVQHPLFQCHFKLDAIPLDSPYSPSGYIPEFWGWFDPDGRLAAIVNYNNDVGDGWELPDEPGFYSKTAFKLGINYIVYSMTH